VAQCQETDTSGLCCLAGSNPVLKPEGLAMAASYESLSVAVSGREPGGLVLFDDRTDSVELATALSRFLSVESCVQCPACMLECTHITALVHSSNASPVDLDVVSARLAKVTDARQSSKQPDWTYPP
jgi:NADH:ubiquinone oxidoreductase subunit F (NADH-binding)